MKKNIKVGIICFILGLIIASSVTVLASQILARDIEYTKDGVTTNVESALNDLYDKSNLYSNFNELIIGINSKVYLDFDVFKENGYSSFKVSNPWKTGTCDIGKIYDKVYGYEENSNYVFDNIYNIPDNQNKRIVLNSVNGQCDFRIYLYR